MKRRAEIEADATGRRLLFKTLVNRLTYRTEWSDDDQMYIAFAVELPSVKAHAKTPEESIQELKIPIKLVLEQMMDEGKPLPEPISLFDYKGNLTLRTTPEKHRELAIRAAESGVSINQYILSKIG